MDIRNLETQYLKAKVAYYEGHPIMSDAAFDVLEKELKSNGSKVIEQVGAKRKDFDFPHPTPLKSLAKFQTESEAGVTNYRELEFGTWLLKRETLVGESFKHMHYSPKFDGSSVNIVYRDGKLESVLTRGDGKVGKDISDRFRKHLPELLPITEYIAEIIEIRCECVMRKSIFQKKYAAEFANARNIVAGILGKDDYSVEKVGDLTLVPLIFLVNGKHQDVDKLKPSLRYYPIFSTGHLIKIRANAKDYLSSVKYMESEREQFDFPLDGIVFSLPIEYRETLGENDHDPEWAIAIKFVPDEVVTPVIGIESNLGKTGEFTPVVILKPVTLAGTSVKRASGYNWGYIIKNKIGEGTFVSIAKAGDIIPEIQKIVIESGLPFELPKICPHCGSTLTFDGIHLMCNNKNCEGIIARKLGAAVGVLDLKGIGGKTIEPFAQDFSNMYDLMVWVLKNQKNINMSKYGIPMGSRSEEIFVNAFKNIKSLKYAQVILIQGYDGIGRKVSEQAAREYCGLTPNYASIEKALVRKLQECEIVSNIKYFVSELESLGITIDKPEDKKEVIGTVYACLTGSPKAFGFKTKEEFMSKFPNLVEVSVTDKNCNYLITDDLNSTSSKMKAADKKGIKIVTYGNFKI